MARGGVELGDIVGRKAGRADDMDDARLRGERGEFDVAAGAVKSRIPSAFATASSGIVGDRDAISPTPASKPASWPSAIEPGRSSAPCSVTPGVFVNRLHEHAAHPPGGAGDDQPHLAHDGPPQGVGDGYRQAGVLESGTTPDRGLGKRPERLRTGGPRSNQR